MDILEHTVRSVKEGRTCVLATVVDVKGSAPRKPGARMVVGAGGERHGSVGGGETEEVALAAAEEMLSGAGKATRMLEVDTGCAGRVWVFLELLRPADRLLVIGAGHVGLATARLASRAGFAVQVLDRAGGGAVLADDGVASVVAEDPEALEQVDGPAATHIVIATGGHDADRDWAVRAMRLGFGSVGVVGSRSKSSRIRRAASEAGIPDDVVGAMRCPVGMEIGAVTPEQIAVAIVGELIGLARGATG